MSDLARHNLLGSSPAFVAALDLVRQYATCDATVLIEGETGTGKEVAARAIHYLGKRSNYPFVPVNCGALPDTLIESELFGHARGAFTDAHEAHSGLVAQARHGTLFLDEIEAMPLRAQAALLRFLQEGEYRPLGGALVKDAAVRIIASSNINLDEMMRRRQFRSDLFFRLCVLPLRLPTLRDRPGDAIVLAESMIERLNRQTGGTAKRLHPESCVVLETYSWPGNVRELENLIHREYLLCTGSVMRLSDMHAPFRTYAIARGGSLVAGQSFREAKARAVAEFERTYLSALLSKTAGNISMASRLAGKDRSDISKLARKYGIDPHQFAGHPSPRQPIESAGS